jgi:plasmid stabilization system protein ParE
MSYKIILLASAEQDMKELRSYIVKNFSLATWQDTYSKLKDSIHNLKDYPFVGSIRKNWNG